MYHFNYLGRSILKSLKRKVEVGPAQKNQMSRTFYAPHLVKVSAARSACVLWFWDFSVNHNQLWICDRSSQSSYI